MASHDSPGVLGFIGSWFYPWRPRGSGEPQEDEPQAEPSDVLQGEEVEQPVEEDEDRRGGDAEDWNLRNAREPAPKGRSLQVFLEETSITNSDHAPVIQTTVTKSFQVISKVTEGAEPDLNMGRKNSGRRRSRKGSHSDASSPREKTPTKSQSGRPATAPVQAETRTGEGVPTETVTSAQAARSRADLVETQRGDEPTHTQDEESTRAADPDSPVRATRVPVVMDEDGDGWVKRTEAPESKRRSTKVSQSTKVFAKKVLVDSDEVERRTTERSGAGTPQDARSSHANAPASPRVAARINMFERRMVTQNARTQPRSLDTSPVTKRPLDAGHPERASSVDRVPVKERVKTFSKAVGTTETRRPASRTADFVIQKGAFKKPERWTSTAPKPVKAKAASQTLSPGPSSTDGSGKVTTAGTSTSVEGHSKPVEQECVAAAKPAPGEDQPDGTCLQPVRSTDSKDVPPATQGQHLSQAKNVSPGRDVTQTERCLNSRDTQKPGGSLKTSSLQSADSTKNLDPLKMKKWKDAKHAQNTDEAVQTKECPHAKKHVHSGSSSEPEDFEKENVQNVEGSELRTAPQANGGSASRHPAGEGFTLGGTTLEREDKHLTPQAKQTKEDEKFKEIPQIKKPNSEMSVVVDTIQTKERFSTEESVHSNDEQKTKESSFDKKRPQDDPTHQAKSNSICTETVQSKDNSLTTEHQRTEGPSLTSRKSSAAEVAEESKGHAASKNSIQCNDVSHKEEAVEPKHTPKTKNPQSNDAVQNRGEPAAQPESSSFIITSSEPKDNLPTKSPLQTAEGTLFKDTLMSKDGPQINKSPEGKVAQTETSTFLAENDVQTDRNSVGALRNSEGHLSGDVQLTKNRSNEKSQTMGSEQPSENSISPKANLPEDRKANTAQSNDGPLTKSTVQVKDESIAKDVPQPDNLITKGVGKTKDNQQGIIPKNVEDTELKKDVQQIRARSGSRSKKKNKDGTVSSTSPGKPIKEVAADKDERVNGQSSSKVLSEDLPDGDGITQPAFKMDTKPALNEKCESASSITLPMTSQSRADTSDTSPVLHRDHTVTVPLEVASQKASLGERRDVVVSSAAEEKSKAESEVCTSNVQEDKAKVRREEEDKAGISTAMLSAHPSHPSQSIVQTTTGPSIQQDNANSANIPETSEQASNEETGTKVSAQMSASGKDVIMVEKQSLQVQGSSSTEIKRALPDTHRSGDTEEGQGIIQSDHMLGQDQEPRSALDRLKATTEQERRSSQVQRDREKQEIEEKVGKSEMFTEATPASPLPPPSSPSSTTSSALIRSCSSQPVNQPSGSTHQQHSQSPAAIPETPGEAFGEQTVTKVSSQSSASDNDSITVEKPSLQDSGSTQSKKTYPDTRRLSDTKGQNGGQDIIQSIHVSEQKSSSVAGVARTERVCEEQRTFQMQRGTEEEGGKSELLAVKHEKVSEPTQPVSATDKSADKSSKKEASAIVHAQSSISVGEKLVPEASSAEKHGQKIHASQKPVCQSQATETGGNFNPASGQTEEVKVPEASSAGKQGQSSNQEKIHASQKPVCQSQATETGGNFNPASGQTEEVKVPEASSAGKQGQSSNQEKIHASQKPVCQSQATETGGNFNPASGQTEEVKGETNLGNVDQEQSGVDRTKKSSLDTSKKMDPALPRLDSEVSLQTEGKLPDLPIPGRSVYPLATDSTKPKISANQKNTVLLNFMPTSQASPSSWLDVDDRQQSKTKQPIRLPTLAVLKKKNKSTGEFEPEDFIKNIKSFGTNFSGPVRRKRGRARLTAPNLPAILEEKQEKTFDLESFKFGLRKRQDFTSSLPKLREQVDSQAEAAEVKTRKTHLEKRSILFQSMVQDVEADQLTVAKQDANQDKEEGALKAVKVKSRLEGSPILSRLMTPSKSRRSGILSPREDSKDCPVSPSEDLTHSLLHATQLSSSVEKNASQKYSSQTTSPSQPSQTQADTRKLENSKLQTIQIQHSADQNDLYKSQTSEIQANLSKPQSYQSQVRSETNDLQSEHNQTQTNQIQVQPNVEDVLTKNNQAQNNQILVQTDQSHTQADQDKSHQIQTDQVLGQTNQSQAQTENGKLKCEPNQLKTNTSDLQTGLNHLQTNYSPVHSSQNLEHNLIQPEQNQEDQRQVQASQTKLQSKKSVLNDKSKSQTEQSNQTDPGKIHSEKSQEKNNQNHVQSQVKIDHNLVSSKDLHHSRHNVVDDKSNMPVQSHLNSGQANQVVSEVMQLPDQSKHGPIQPGSSESKPPLPCFDHIGLPFHLENVLPREHQMAGPLEKQKSEVCTVQSTHPSDISTPPPLHLNKRLAANGYHRRPGKMLLFEHVQFGGRAYELFRDVYDATSFTLSGEFSARVVRGCWILYEKPGFEGRSLALEEGNIELANVWEADEAIPTSPMVIGSIRLAVSDYSPPLIALFTEPCGHGTHTQYHCETPELCMYGIPQNTGSIKVHSGVWLVYSEPMFQGLLAVLETGEYPTPDTWGFPSPAVGSVRPLCMGPLKVENPAETKALLYEQPGLQGPCVEIQGEVFDVRNGHTESTPSAHSHTDTRPLRTVGSMKILSGLWVGYEEVGFEGRQFVLEEGEYLDWTDWGGVSKQLLSVRPVLADFTSPRMKLFSAVDFGDVGASVDLLEAVVDTQNTGYGLTTNSIRVFSGVWVAFEKAGFSGQLYVLEKGLYEEPEDWGAENSNIGSTMPVVQNDMNVSKFKVELFSEPGLQGSVLVREGSEPDLPSDFRLQSCRVLSGSWLAFEREEFSGSVCVLEEGVFPDLRAMGFQHNGLNVRSLQITGFEFSPPSVMLCERPGLRGRRAVLTDGSVNLQLTGSLSRAQSLLVKGGMWVLYEGVNFRGSQTLLKPGEVSDWPKVSGWQQIGSLRPLMQRQVHFFLRNQESGLLLSVTGSWDDIKLLRVQAVAETGGLDQVWSYQNGHLLCKALDDCCVEPMGGSAMAGCRLCVSAEHGKPHQVWSLTSEGFIRSNANPDLVLDIKGGQQYDRTHIILNTHHPSRQSQRWTVEIL
ncbi:uncharacterized protein LOC114763391 [Denticeps clupeoides]|uniref:uncharacterized protein LOC114763391 n=1 Tax=Denticeps clupeoides TaxID=299321 RepID=UPI0010A39B85|nr:uncharacterized protein LOC114763391 [Denticeps clupeoides]